ncbi:hypothetical protein PLICRDRAFT_335149 [Plicaturopsis crispa FD-325 SS-3]|uniref:Uncharacterized protein n=1 Tax=Plicaturopsis crispa FD-325 SS-3 TaxID=944288 RepID=A0A0C9SLB3_PLICR|nr:hypothetical protein PLICRDRAFT_335149 [Plicaturopsis crispa FD-325 SS-3]
MSNETRASLTIAILEAQFHSVKSLQGYLRETLNPDAHGGYGFTPTTADSREYRSLIETTYVALKSIPECGRRIDVFPPMEDMHDSTCKAAP